MSLGDAVAEKKINAPNHIGGVVRGLRNNLFFQYIFKLEIINTNYMIKLLILQI